MCFRVQLQQTSCPHPTCLLPNAAVQRWAILSHNVWPLLLDSVSIYSSVLMWRKTLPSKVICIHSWVWYFNPLSLLFSFQAAPAVGSVKPADKSAKKSSRAKVNRLDIKDVASLSNSLAALRIILDNLNSSLEHDLTFIKSSVSGLTAWKVPSSLPSSCGRCKHCQTSRQAC